MKELNKHQLWHFNSGILCIIAIYLAFCSAILIKISIVDFLPSFHLTASAIAIISIINININT